MHTIKILNSGMKLTYIHELAATDPLMKSHARQSPSKTTNLLVQTASLVKSSSMAVIMSYTGFTSPRPSINIRSEDQRSSSQGHKVQKHTSGDRVTGVSYALYRVPSL